MRFKYKFSFLLLLFFPVVIHSEFAVTRHKQKIKHHSKGDRQHYLIEFKNTPTSSEQHEDWIIAIYTALKSVNDVLISRKLIAPLDRFKNTQKNNSFVEWIKDFLEEKIYDIFFHTHTITYPHKKNQSFVTRHNGHFGSLGIYAPDGVSPDIFLKILYEEIHKRGVAVRIIPDAHMHLINSFPESYSNVSFSNESLDAFKDGKLQKNYQNKLNKLQEVSKDRLKTNTEKILSTKYEDSLKVLNDLERQLFWYQEVPTTGLRMGRKVTQKNSKTGVNESIILWSTEYPFLPHRFPLWQMAPKLGEGVRIGIVDSGIAAFSFKETSEEAGVTLPHIRKNKDLAMHGDFLTRNYNLTQINALNPLDELVDFVASQLERERFESKSVSYVLLEQECVKWIQNYLKDKSLEAVDEYLRKNSVEQLFTQGNRKTFSSIGKEVRERIEQEMKVFHLVTIIDDNTGKPQSAILEFLPIAPISNNTEKLLIGHGSHIAGIAAGKMQQLDIVDTHYQPTNDLGVCGIAPRAKIIMVKCFRDDGGGHHSALISALTRMLSHDVHVVNMSLKISDYLNKESGFSKSLETLINMFPYCVAASGNDGDPHKKGYPGMPIENYPARLPGIAFDVGAFGWDYKEESCPIAPFSQYQLSQEGTDSIGPKFVAPGHNILNCGLKDNQKYDSVYVIAQGTSCAAPIITGFVALMLSEFPDGENFTRDQLLKVCYSSGIKMHDSTEWQQKAIFGSLDMRTVLFTLHVLQEFKKEHTALFIQKFDVLVKMVQTQLFGMANEYAQKYLNGVEFKNNFMGFYNKATQLKQGPNLSDPIFHDFIMAKKFAVESLSYATGASPTKPSQLSNTLAEKMKEVFNGTPNLFENLHQAAQNRVTAVFNTSHQITDEVKRYLGTIDSQKLSEFSTPYKSYWHQQATLFKSR